MSTAGKGVSLSWDLLFQDALQPGEELPQNRLLSLLSYRSCHLAENPSLL